MFLIIDNLYILKTETRSDQLAKLISKLVQKINQRGSKYEKNVADRDSNYRMLPFVLSVW